MTYTAPLREQRFLLETLADIGTLGAAAGLDADMIDPILGEAAKLAENVFAPLNRAGDTIGARLADGVVTLPPGYAEAYRQFVEGGWMGLCAPVEAGGQGLPFVLSCAVQEQFMSANLSFQLGMMLTMGAVEAIAAHGDAALKATYLPPLVEGRWSGTMNLTEPQAGSDVGAISATARPLGDGRFAVDGTKIYISWGEHELSENIVHLVLARLPGAPAGTKGLSMFLVPKHLPDGSRNDVVCTTLEHKLGLHASPTCVMRFGEKGQCIGWLVGPEHGGMRAMFTMMNNARISVGLEGVAIAERAYQAAAAYARDRVQSAKIGGDRKPVAIIEHPDVRRMLLTIRAHVEAARAIVYVTAAAVDRSHSAKDADARAAAQGLADLLTPVAKAWSSDIGFEMSSIALQVFGGMGYVEETGAAQHLRDARIPMIYEGTNGIQALDLVMRKLSMDGGRHWRALLAECAALADAAESQDGLRDLAGPVRSSLARLEQSAEWLLAHPGVDAAAGATPFLRMFGTVTGATLLLKQALAAHAELAGSSADDFLVAKIATARFFVLQLLPAGVAQEAAVISGIGEIDAFPVSAF